MKGILTDVTKCIGCHKCEDACAEVNGLDELVPSRQRNGDGLGSNRWTTIVTADKGRFVRKHCRHCLDPACASACIVGALEKTKEGPVIYDKDKCMGCRYCMMACPYAIPRYSWEDAVPYVRKCIMCYDRIKEGKQPACTEACPQGATIFGDRDMLLMEAKNRIRNEPDKYIHKVYGEHEVGGTSVMYISDVPLDFLGWSGKLGSQPLPELTWKVMRLVPGEFLGMGAVMGSIWWITGRRKKVAEAEEIAAEMKAREESAAGDETEQEEESANEQG